METTIAAGQTKRVLLIASQQGFIAANVQTSALRQACNSIT
jgi:hypothetical protein